MRGTLTVELCGKLADSYGGEITLDLSPGGLTVGELIEAVAKSYPMLAPLLAVGRIRACVNEVIVPDTAIVRQGDIAALFPPVSGK